MYREVGKILAIRRERIELRRGRQYLRPISDSGAEGTVGVPHMIGGQIRSVVPWSRIFNDREILLAINTDAGQARTAWATIDNSLHAAGSTLTCLYSTQPGDIGSIRTVEARNGKAVQLVPAAGFVIYE